MQVGIVGGGIMGITLGYLLARRGVQVEIFEASPVLGGLAGPLHLPDGVAVDRFYHAILSSDASLMQLCQELGITDQLRFRETRTGFFHEGGLYSMNNLVEFLTFKPLGLIDRFRLGLTVLYAQLWNDWRKLEGEPVERWLIRASGRRTYEAIWGQMLKAKFDGAFADIPATWMWSRLVRTKSTRKGVNQKEMSGHLIGGYATLLKAMAERIEAAGGVVHLQTPVQEIVIEQGRARGIRVNGEIRPYDAVAATVQVPLFQRLIPAADAAYRDFLGQTEYLGVVCPLLVLDRPLTGFWTLNITDLRVPFTGVIETTSYIDPQYVGGHHLVYIPKYTAPGSAWQTKSDEEIKATWIENLKLMFPDFDERRIRHFLVHRERYVEPLHRLNSTHLIPEIRTPIAGLYLATTAQIYPALTNGESVTRHAQTTVDQILADQPSARPVPVSG
ncbi:MAG TPA: NAD(P)/FAD-dependent oxidoreductase [Anaerolineales bacterium]|nr:NAD(P)/FAD-dependent oxidoreductase [Anaerolineales bacterium]HRF47973.1 NAD(P)/FAD-dependent oxidoreductase [Anaerolineales bacterium]